VGNNFTSHGNAKKRAGDPIGDNRGDIAIKSLRETGYSELKLRLPACRSTPLQACFAAIANRLVQQRDVLSRP